MAAKLPTPTSLATSVSALARNLSRSILTAWGERMRSMIRRTKVWSGGPPPAGWGPPGVDAEVYEPHARPAHEGPPVGQHAANVLVAPRAPDVVRLQPGHGPRLAQLLVERVRVDQVLRRVRVLIQGGYGGFFRTVASGIIATRTNHPGSPFPCLRIQPALLGNNVRTRFGSPLLGPAVDVSTS